MQNSAMSARCVQCHTLLISTAEPRAPEVQELVKSMDRDISALIGSIVGLLIGALILQNAAGAALFCAIGGGIGKLVARHRAKNGL